METHFFPRAFFRKVILLIRVLSAFLSFIRNKARFKSTFIIEGYKEWKVKWKWDLESISSVSHQKHTWEYVEYCSMFYAIHNYEEHKTAKRMKKILAGKTEKEKKNAIPYIHAETDAMRKMWIRNCEILSRIRGLTVVANFDFYCRCAYNAILPPSIPPPSCCADTSSSSPRTCQRYRTCTKWSPSSTPAGTSSISPNLFGVHNSNRFRVLRRIFLTVEN